MSKYLVTLSWFDPEQPLRRLKKTLTVDIEDIAGLEIYDIIREIERQNWRADFAGQGAAIDFMMKIGD